MNTKRNLFKLFFVSLLAFAGASCVDDISDVVAPELTISTEQIAVPAEGGTFVVEIEANCVWNVTTSSIPTWATVEPLTGYGNGRVVISVPESTSRRSATISFEMTHPEYGKWGKADQMVLLTQYAEGEDPDYQGDGSKEHPYTVTEALNVYKNGGTTLAWVQGPIVGSCPGIDFASFVTDTGSAASNTNIVIGSVDGDMMPIQLPSEMRSALSLQNKPENLGKTVAIYGSIEKYFGVAGLKSPTEYVLDGTGSGGGSGNTDPDPGTASGDGSKEKPYSVDDVLALYNANQASQAVWITGTVLGTCTDISFDSFTPEAGASASNTNIVIGKANGDSKLPVQLPAAMRAALSLQQNPSLLNTVVTVHGTIEKYFGVAGIKNVDDYVLGDNTGGNTGGDNTDPTPTPGTIGSITAAGTYSLAEATVVAAGSQAYIIADATGAMMVYHNNHSRKVGEKISISGAVTIYNATSIPQFSESAEVKVLSSNNAWEYKPATVAGASFDALAQNIKCQEVQFDGKLVVSGNYLNVDVEGASNKGSIKYVAAADYSAFDGKNITIKGYFVGTSTSAGVVYINVLPYVVKEVGAADPEQPGGGTTEPENPVDPTPSTGAFKKVTTVTSGKQYLIVGTYNNTYYALDGSAVRTGGGAVEAADKVVTVASDAIANNSTVSKYAVTITANGSGYTIRNADGKYIEYSGSSTGIKLADSSSRTWTVSSNNGFVKFADANTPTRVICYRYSTEFNRFAAYLESNVDNAEYFLVTLYELAE